MIADRRSLARGQVLALAALFMVVLLVSAALVTDYGAVLSSRRSYQATADAAALSGAHWLVEPDKDFCTSAVVCARRSGWDQLNSHLGLGLADATLTSYASVNTAAAGQVVGPTWRTCRRRGRGRSRCPRPSRAAAATR